MVLTISVTIIRVTNNLKLSVYGFLCRIRAGKMSDYRLHTLNGYISNIYIAEYSDKLLLLDCGTKNDVERIKSFCEEKLNRSIKDIKLAVVSHNHPDHSGGASLLRQLYGIPIAAGRGVDLWYKGASGFIQHKIDCLLAHVVRRAHRKKLQPVVFNRYVEPDYIIDDYEQLPGFSDWQVVYVPGHTLHDIVLYNMENRLLYSSDCIINVNDRCKLPIPVIVPSSMKQSFQKLMAMDLTTILPAHGDIINTDSPEKEFQKMIDMIYLPATDMAKTVQNISVFTPQIWKAYLKKIKRRYREMY